MRGWRRCPCFPGESGGALLYAMLVAAIFAVIGTQIARRGTNGLVYVQDDKLKIARETLYNRVNTVASIEESLATSLGDPANAALIQCLTYGAGCASYNAGIRIPMVLYTPEGARVAGTWWAPQSYDHLGNPCNTNCVFSVYAYFWVGCKGGGGCAFPDTVYTLVQVQTTGGNPLNLANPASMPKDAQIIANPMAYANTLIAAKITQKKIVCPPGTAQVQYNQGHIQCQCIAGVQTGTDANGYPICSVTPQCPINTIFMSIDALGTPQCAPVAVSNCFTGYASTTFTCGGSCTQNGPIQMDCGSNGPIPYRMVGFTNDSNGSSCQQTAAPNKKTGSPGTYQCVVAYTYQCCG